MSGIICEDALNIILEYAGLWTASRLRWASYRALYEKNKEYLGRSLHNRYRHKSFARDWYIQECLEPEIISYYNVIDMASELQHFVSIIDKMIRNKISNYYNELVLDMYRFKVLEKYLDSVQDDNLQPLVKNICDASLEKNKKYDKYVIRIFTRSMSKINNIIWKRLITYADVNRLLSLECIAPKSIEDTILFECSRGTLFIDPMVIKKFIFSNHGFSDRFIKLMKYERECMIMEQFHTKLDSFNQQLDNILNNMKSLTNYSEEINNCVKK